MAPDLLGAANAPSGRAAVPPFQQEIPKKVAFV
jgi:hypothetical protein